MSNATATAVPVVALPTGRLIAAGAIVVVWFLAKVLGPIAIISTDLSAEAKAMISAVLFFGVAKLCLLAVIFVLGKPGFAFLKAKMFAAFGRAFARIAPPKEVGRARYRIGLVMFILPLLIGAVMPYVEKLVPYVDELNRPLDWFWDLVFVASFFVLGGDFWDKLRALFVHGAKVQFPDEVAGG